MKIIQDRLTAGQEQALFELLSELVSVQSGSHNRPGVNRVGRLVRAALAGPGLDLELETVAGGRYGDHLVFRTRAASGPARPILVTGHMDTVFPPDTPFTDCTRQGRRIHGPGVIDMKGGLVVTIGACRLLARAGLLAGLPLVLLFNSDEEAGSPSSLPILRRLARECSCALVTECGGMNGEVVTGRRGKTGYRLTVHGRAGHAAFAGRDKASAILELAGKIIALEGCNDREVVVNVGMVEGGIGPNTVADHATALVDSRYPDQEAGARLRRKISEICAVTTVAGTRCRLEITNERPVMERCEANLRLFRLLARVGERLGIVVREEVRRGVSDANTLAGEGLPVLDGLGPLGEFDHSEEEYLLAPSLPRRTLLLANYLAALAEEIPVPEDRNREASAGPGVRPQRG